MDQNRIRYLTDNFAAEPEELAMLRIDGCTDTSVYIQLLQLRGRRSEEALYCRIIEEECGKTESVIRKELSFINSTEPSIEISLEMYYKYGAYTLNVLNEKEAMAQWLDKLGKYISLRDCIIMTFENERMPFSAFEKELKEAQILLSEMLSNGRKMELFRAIKYIRPDLSKNTEEFDKVTVDIELSINVLGFVPEEYVSYHFWEKSFAERLEYVSDRLRKKVGQLLNPKKGREVLNNKYLTYRALKPLYGRKIRQMDADGGFAAFSKSFRENTVLVKKNNFQSLGKEFKIIEATEGTDLHAVYDRIKENGSFFILEDLIRPHSELKRLNPDSVNTVRIMTLLEQGKPVVLDSFLRTGRIGSIVDNGSAGGIFVHVDHVKGITDSHGIDERGFFYDSHPDHRYSFSGIRLPFWEEALKTACAAALTIPHARYVGWDLTCTEDNRWIIVEGNAMAMYIGQQATIGVGIRKKLLEQIGFKNEP